MPDTDTLRWMAELARPFPDSMVRSRPVGGGVEVDYVNHADLTAKLLILCGPFDQDVEHLDGDVWRVTLTLDTPAGRRTVQEVSTDSDAEAAVSRALCRAAMRFGAAIDLWAQTTRYYESLRRRLGDDDVDPEGLPTRDLNEEGEPW